MIALATATLGFWLGAGLPAAAAWSAAVAVLVVACPCALGLATPTALLAAVEEGRRGGWAVRRTPRTSFATQAVYNLHSGAAPVHLR